MVMKYVVKKLPVKIFIDVLDKDIDEFLNVKREMMNLKFFNIILIKLMKKLKLLLIVITLSLLTSLNLMAYSAQVDPDTPLQIFTGIGEFNTDGNLDTWDYAEIGNVYVSNGYFHGTHNGGYPHMARVPPATGIGDCRT